MVRAVDGEDGLATARRSRPGGRRHRHHDAEAQRPRPAPRPAGRRRPGGDPGDPRCRPRRSPPTSGTASRPAPTTTSPSPSSPTSCSSGSRSSSGAEAPVIRDDLIDCLSRRPRPRSASSRPPRRPARAPGPARARRLVLERGPGHRQGGGRNPRELAAELAEHLERRPAGPRRARSRSPGPGFVNFHLAPTWLHDVLRDVVDGRRRATTPARRSAHGERVHDRVRLGQPHRARPRRQRLVRLLRRLAGPAARALRLRRQPRVLRQRHRRADPPPRRAACWPGQAGEPVPEGGYPSGFVKGLAARLRRPRRRRPRPAGGRPSASSAFIRDQMESVHIHFDEWFSQASIEESEAVAETDRRAARPRAWCARRTAPSGCAPRDFGDPRERAGAPQVPNGDYTYLAGDLAYHRNKFLVRGFDRVINVWGADHQGQVASLHAGVEALGVERGRLEVRHRPDGLARQRAHVASGSATPSTSTTWSTTSAPTPCGCCRCSPRSTRRRPSTSTRCGPSRKESPVYYVQYAHARIALDRPGGRPSGASSGCRSADVDLAPARPRARARRCCARCPSCPTSWSLACDRAGPAQGRRPGCASWPTGSTASTTTATCWATACQPELDPGPPVAGRGGPHRLRHRPRPARRQRPGVDVSSRGTVDRPASLALATCCPTRPRSAPTAGWRIGGCDLRRRWPPSSARRCSSTTRTTCGPAAARRSPRSATAWPTPPRRSCAGPWPGSSTRRACTSTSPPAASCTSRWPPACPPTGSCCTATTRATTSCAGPARSGVGRIVVDSFDELDRLERAPRRRRHRCPQVLLRVTPGRRGPHPRVRADRPGRLQVRLRPGRRRRGRGGRAGRGVAGRRARRHPRPHRQPGVRRRLLPTRRSRSLAPFVARRSACPSCRRRRPRRRLRRGRGGADASPSGATVGARRVRGTPASRAG